MPRLRSLQGRLLLLVLGGVLVSWAAVSVFTWFDAQHELDELLDGHLAQAAALLVVQQVRADDDEHHGLDAPTLHRYAPQVAFQVWHEGRLSMRSSNAPDRPMRAEGSGFREGFHTLQLAGQPWRVFAAYGAERDVQVYVGEQLKSRRSILKAVLRGAAWPLALALPLLALVVWAAVRRGTAPLRQLGRTVAARDPQAVQPVEVDDAPSEMRPLVDALNGLFGRIAALLDSERRFTADAAHELRTPIAAIRAQAQVALGAEDDAARRHALRATLEGCDRATRLVEQLLTLARVEAGPPQAGATLDLAALVRRVAAELAPAALDKQQLLQVEADAPCAVQGNETLLAVLLRNLLDNAVRYSPPQAPVCARVGVADAGAWLRIEDGGSGLDAGARARLGERFFRVVGSGQSGSGLGWSIVRRIAAAQGIAVEVGASDALGGLAVTLRWPATHRPQAEQGVG